ncbi:branched-chain amino acid transaminase [Dictyobacter kobayashii]|uniref:Branched-chain-amino-acid aminotransferase n=1 Tax=Dictyobacter kobayashii TaxID=2014872 RepID=A0A402AGY4_9CHLR|nr:branched-chain amino acid transaminase [Dictyobacter kobayashii]GCE18381.1 branched chain amino acid aminotransferase [Dictyobacter kobayashii]
MDAKILYMNGEYIPAERGFISVRSHGFAYGTGVFEGIRGYWNEEQKQVYLFRLREHYERLHRSCKIMRINLPYTVEQLIEHSVELVKRNEQQQDVYQRPVAYKSDEIIGVRLHGLHDDYLLTSEPMGNYVEIGGLRCGVSSWRRIDDNAIPARAKICGSYVNAAFAKTEAIQNGFDEAIMLNHEGHVSEGSAENIFLFQNGELITPAPSENILLGITRDTIIQLAQKELGINVRERQIDRTELYTADEIFLCGTGAQIAPVIEVDHNPVGNGTTGPIGQKLQDLYFDIVRGRNSKYLDWCTPVYSEVASPTK